MHVGPSTWVVVAGILALAFFNWFWNARRRPQAILPVNDVISFVGGGRWTRFGILDAPWPMVRLAVGTDALYHGPNDRWPLTRLHRVPQWRVTPEDVEAARATISAVHVKLKGGRDLVFVPMFGSR